MSTGRTTRSTLPYPTGTDDFNLRADFRALAEELDDFAIDKHGTLAGRPDAASVRAGTYYFADNTGLLSRSDGTAWHDVAPSDAGAGTPSMRTLGTGAAQAAAGNDARFTNQRTPSDGSVTNAKVASSAAIDEAKLALASDAAPSVPSRRTLGTGPVQAVSGTDARLSDTRTPRPHGASHAAGGSDPVPGFGGNAPAHKLTHEPGGSDALTQLTHQSIAAANVDGAAGTPGMRSLGGGATQAAAGNDARLYNPRSPTPHAASHLSGGSDPLPSNASPGTPSLRSLGSGSTQAAPGNDARLAAADGVASQWITLFERGLRVAGGARSSGTPFILMGPDSAETGGGGHQPGGGNAYFSAAYYIDPADNDVPGYTTVIRVRAMFACADSATPGGNVQVALFPVTAVGGAVPLIQTLGSAVAIATITPVTSDSRLGISAHWTPPSAGRYVLGLHYVGPLASGSGTDAVEAVAQVAHV